ncbi:MAG: purine-cytosine permease family protein [Solirubrobacteraceae bacterium]
MAKPRSSDRLRRGFGRLVENPMLEDYSLRYAPSTFRRWSELAVATAALGSIAYLADFAIGASIAITYGFTNALASVLLAAVVIFITSVPIAYYSAKYSVDMDLLTRGAGFGYFGSTITSLIYASFTFIFFALEGSIMAQAFQFGLGIPLAAGYLIAALIVIPLVIFGMTLLAKLQMWTQPIWMILMVAPFVSILIQHPGAFSSWTGFKGHAGSAGFSGISMGLGAGIALSLIAQIGEQVDYLRFMPAKTPATAKRWWAAVLAAGPGWVILGAAKQLGGGFLAYYVATKVGLTKAGEPIQQYLGGAGTFVPSGILVAVAVFFVVLSQVKINVTNAYSGSLSWSNFFSRVFHWHPGRVVWVFFNVGIALTLMEVGVFSFLNTVLGFYSNVAIAWIGAVAADLAINKPLGLSPSYIEFKRANLYSVNPVGFGAMAVASIISILAFYHGFGHHGLGNVLAAYSTFLALGIAVVLSPLLAIATKGRYYIAREPTLVGEALAGEPGAGEMPALEALPEIACTVCGESYEAPDMASCPFHEAPICSLCCTLEKSCHDMCKASVRDAIPHGARAVPGPVEASAIHA